MPQPPWHLTPNAPLDMDGQKITNLAAGVAADDAATVAQAGGGGGLPSQWVVDADGGLTINDDALSADFANLLILKTNGGTKFLWTTDSGGDAEWTFIESGTSFRWSTQSDVIASLAATQWQYIPRKDDGTQGPSLTFAGGSGALAGRLTVAVPGGDVALELQIGQVSADNNLKFNIQGPASLFAGECSFFFDPTNGAGAFKLDGKTADGTAVSATIPMAHVQVLGWITEPPDGATVKYDQANRALASAQQTALADLNLGTLTLLTDAITAIGTMQTKINSLLAKLRTAGVLAT